MEYVIEEKCLLMSEMKRGERNYTATLSGKDKKIGQGAYKYLLHIIKIIGITIAAG